MREVDSKKEFQKSCVGLHGMEVRKMPDWVWIIIVLAVVCERLTKVRVFDFARGFIRLEFDNEKTDKLLKPVSRRKRVER
jgi:hypothetical protein